MTPVLIAAWIMGDVVCVSTDPCVAPTWYVLTRDGSDIGANAIEPLFQAVGEADPDAPGLYTFRVATVDDQGRRHHEGQPMRLCVSRSTVDCWWPPDGAPQQCEPERDRFVACCQAGGCA